MATQMSFVHTIVVLCLYWAVAQAEDTSSIENLLKRMDTFEEQGRIQLRRIDQQDRLLEIYEEQLKQYETKLQYQTNRINHLEDQLYRTGQEEKLFSNDTPPEQKERVKELKYQSQGINQLVEQEQTFHNEAESAEKDIPSRQNVIAPNTKRHFIKMSERNADTEKSIKFPRLLLDNAEGPVAFHATNDLRTTPVGLNQHILYEDVHLNLGNAFHQLHGLFIAPKAGIYLFSTSIMIQTSKGEILASIEKNGIDLARAYANGNSGGPDQGSVTVVTQLNVGDEVWVKSYDRTAASDYGDKFTSFMGILLIEL